MGLVQNIDQNEFYYIQFLKKSGETSFTVKVGDKDMITKDKIIKVIDAVNYKVNDRGRYVVNYLATNLDIEHWFVVNKDWLLEKFLVECID